MQSRWQRWTGGEALRLTKASAWQACGVVLLAMVITTLLLVGRLALPPFAALTLSVGLSLALCIGARWWLVRRMRLDHVAHTECLLAQWFQTTRDIETRPDQASAALARLLKVVFDPVEASLRDEPVAITHTPSDGSTLWVSTPAFGKAVRTTDLGARAGSNPGPSILLRHAHQGQRPFTAEDARLADHIAEHVRRTVAFDQAVEQGRSDERRRLAQDLHDDIGARLLTLMYKAHSPEMEDYARHTLQDLKTLTRGLAASNQPLSHALAEWKADIAQRLTAAHIALKWTATQDADVVLSMVQWSALTRVLRELVTNVMAHAQARAIEIDVSLISDRLIVTVTDDGMGQAPEQWAPGLGLGGVRKRVRQLGGEVTWQERLPRGVCCCVTVERLSASG